MSKSRLDRVLVERGFAETRAKAQALIMAGQVRVEGQVAAKASQLVLENALIAIDSGQRFVSRGGEKLEAALDAFDIVVSGLICADVGASTGGFTDCLLQRGAAKVFAIDVGKGVLHWRLRTDERVVVMEESNARYLTALPEPVDLVTIDASFISLRILLPVVKNWGVRGCIVALIKPQFEAGRSQSAKSKGVIRDADIHRQVLTNLLNFAVSEGFSLNGLIRSPLVGPKGNVEFFTILDDKGTSAGTIPDLIESVIDR